jgi:2'-5' RNA ligase
LSGASAQASLKLTTVIMIVAPHEVQAVAVPLMRRYSPDSLARVPAHLTVLYPFVEYDHLDDACFRLEHIFAGIAPFEITMDGYGEFPTVLYMKPRDPGPIKRIFRRVYQDFPDCAPYGGTYGDDLTPHMTVGEFESPAELAAAKAALPRYQPITFRATRLHVMYGIDHVTLPWITHTVIPLGG